MPIALQAPRLVVATAPATEPVTLAELKAHLRIDTEAEDAPLAALLATARGTLESITGRSFVQTEWVAYYDAWPLAGTYLGAPQAREIELPKAPLLSVASTVVSHVKYLDTDGNLQTLSAADYTVEPGLSANWFGRIWLKPAASIPTIGEFPGALRVTFYAGYGAAAAVPEEIKTAIKLLAAHLHTNPVPVNAGSVVNEVPMTLQFLIQHLMVRSLA